MRELRLRLLQELVRAPVLFTKVPAHGLFVRSGHENHRAFDFPHADDGEFRRMRTSTPGNDFQSGLCRDQRDVGQGGDIELDLGRPMFG